MSNPPESLRLEVGATSHQGLVRTENQDRPGRVRSPFGEVIIVTDGMGGHRGGATAAAMVVDGFAAQLQSISPTTPVTEAIQRAAQLTNADIHRKATDGDPETARMGATVVLVVVIGNQLLVGHAGDSRAYLFRAGQLTRLTRDHSFVQSMVDRNLLTEEQARDHPSSNVVTRAFGQKPDIEFEISAPVALQAGDRIMLCSDGLCGYVDDTAIEHAMSQPGSAPQITAALIDLALAAGGEDNVTVQVLQLFAPRSEAVIAPPLTAPRASSWLILGLIFIGIILAAAATLHIAGVIRLWPLSAAINSEGAKPGEASDANRTASDSSASEAPPTTPQRSAPDAESGKPANDASLNPPPAAPAQQPQKPVGITLPSAPLAPEEANKRFTELRVAGRKVAVMLSVAAGQPADRFIYYRGDDTAHEEANHIAANHLADRLGYAREHVRPFSEMPVELAKDFAGYDIVIRP